MSGPSADPFTMANWAIDNCYLHESAGQLALVDHNIQSTVFRGTKEEVYRFLKGYATRKDLHRLFGMDADDLENDF